MEQNERDEMTKDMKEIAGAMTDAMPDETLRLSFYIAAIQGLVPVFAGVGTPEAYDVLSDQALASANASLRGWKKRDTETARTATVPVELLRGLVRAAEILENQEPKGEIWDTTAGEALKQARDLGFAVKKSTKPVPQFIEKPVPAKSVLSPFPITCDTCKREGEARVTHLRSGGIYAQCLPPGWLNVTCDGEAHGTVCSEACLAKYL